MIDPPDETVYAVWDGTNDLGYYAFIQDEQVSTALLQPLSETRRQHF